ncbi:DnaD domain protein [Lysinibacillus sp. NPDC047702]|uniref:DnaD domain protein n=1 Tax=unclassified Lysinibacillus TaxID=2636778 RepID=UPI003CFEF551
MSGNNQRDFKGIWIPSNIWLTKELTLQEKVFLVEIDSLDNEHGCFASNKHFANFFQLSTSRCSEIINELRKKGLIEILVTYKPGTKQVETRILRVNKMHEIFTGRPIRETEEGIRKIETGIRNPEGGVRNVEAPPSGKAKGNNTLINNTNYTDDIDKDAVAFEITSFFQENVKHTLSPIEIQTLEYWAYEYPKDLILEAIKRTSFANAVTVKYTERILLNWQHQRFTTLQDVLRSEQAFEQRKRNQSSYSNKQNGRKEPIPDWFENRNDDINQTSTTTEESTTPVMDFEAERQKILAMLGKAK